MLGLLLEAGLLDFDMHIVLFVVYILWNVALF